MSKKSESFGSKIFLIPSSSFSENESQSSPKKKNNQQQETNSVSNPAFENNYELMNQDQEREQASTSIIPTTQTQINNKEKSILKNIKSNNSNPNNGEESFVFGENSGVVDNISTVNETSTRINDNINNNNNSSNTNNLDLDSVQRKSLRVRRRVNFSFIKKRMKMNSNIFTNEKCE